MKSRTYPGQAILEIPTDNAHTAQLKTPDGLGVDIIALTGDRAVAEKLIAGIKDAHDLVERVPAPPPQFERHLGNFVNTASWVALFGFVPAIFYFGAIALGGDLDRNVVGMQKALAASAAVLIASFVAGLTHSAIRQHRERALPSKPGAAA